jgi:hypothetical protein
MGLRISGFVSVESVTMTVIYLIDSTQKKYYGHVEYMIPKVGCPVHIQLRVPMKAGGIITFTYVA